MDNSHDPPPSSESTLETFNILRYLCLLGIFLLLVVGVYQANIVFQQVGRLIMDPKHAETSVDQIAKMIDYESLRFAQENNNVISFGRLLSFLLLLSCYLVWLWVPLAIIATCARLLLVGLMPRRRINQSKAS